MKVADYKGYEIHYDSSSKGFSAFDRVKDESGHHLDFVAGDESQPALEKKLDELGKRVFKKFPAIHLTYSSALQGFVTSIREKRAGYLSGGRKEIVVFSYKTERDGNAHTEADFGDLYEVTPDNLQRNKDIEAFEEQIRLSQESIKTLRKAFTSQLNRERILELGRSAK